MINLVEAARAAFAANRAIREIGKHGDYRSRQLAQFEETNDPEHLIDPWGRPLFTDARRLVARCGSIRLSTWRLLLGGAS